jgi:serine O-acetyltransferase
VSNRGNQAASGALEPAHARAPFATQVAAVAKPAEARDGLSGPLTWSETVTRIRADRKRLLAMLAAQPGAATKAAFFHPSFICVLLYRISSHLFRSRHYLAARVFWQLSFVITGADISPAAELGEGLLILSPAGTALMGVAGRNLTVMPCAGIGGEMGNLEDIGAGPGLPLLQDDVILEPHTGILGPIRVGSRVRVHAGLVLTKDAPDDADIVGPEHRFIGPKNAL